MTTTIGTVRQVDLRVFAGADLVFDVQWTEADGVTPIEISAVASKIRKTLAGAVLLNIGTYATIDGSDASIVHVAVPASITAALTPTETAVWDFKVEAVASGEERVLMSGAAKIRGVASV